MKSYTGTKTINAKPMNRVDYNVLRGWTLPDNENGSDEGFLVEYTDGGKSNHPEFAGYISWSPADVFEKAYRLNFATDDNAIEQEIQAKGKTAPRVTPADLQANISSEFYFTGSDGAFGATGYRPVSMRAGTALTLLTFCVLVLRNGFTVTGESACASPENFDPEIGRKIARQNAEQKVWPLMGYALKERLNNAKG